MNSCFFLFQYSVTCCLQYLSLWNGIGPAKSRPSNLKGYGERERQTETDRHTHAHTHTQRERERERERYGFVEAVFCMNSE